MKISELTKQFKGILPTHITLAIDTSKQTMGAKQVVMKLFIKNNICQKLQKLRGVLFVIFSCSLAYFITSKIYGKFR
jgi:hypothetical protein